MTMSTLERPFHFIIVLWGEQFVRTFLEYCLPSLLAPGNFPALSTEKRSKLVVATVPQDWAMMKGSRTFQEAERYVDTVFLEIPPCPPGKSAVVHMGIGHVAACNLAFEERAYAAVFTPDCMFSDGTVRNLQAHAAKGVELVWVAALRFAEEPFFAHLRALGAIPDESRIETGNALAISGRQMVFAAINGFHTETLSYEWHASYFPRIPSAAWWRVPGENGIVVHSLSWAPLLLDFGSVRSHDVHTLENWSIDGDYVFRNLGPSPKVHLVQDSDEIFLSSWSPMTDRPALLEPRYGHRFNWMNSVRKGWGFREAFEGPVFDPLKRKFFFRPVRWHANPLNAKWRQVEREARRALQFHLGVRASSSAQGRHVAALPGRAAALPGSALSSAMFHSASFGAALLRQRPHVDEWLFRRRHAISFAVRNNAYRVSHRVKSGAMSGVHRLVRIAARARRAWLRIVLQRDVPGADATTPPGYKASGLDDAGLRQHRVP